MRRTDNYAANQIRILLTELNGSSHADKKKALAAFQTYVETYHPEVADENVDYLFTGCINGKMGTGLLHWGGVASDNRKSAELKRICPHVVKLIRWLVTHESDSERGNMYYNRFVQLNLVDLRQLNFPKHITSKKKKRKRLDEEDENEDIFVLLAILVNDHRTPQGKVSRLEVDDLLMFDEEANEQYADWVNSGAIEQIPNYQGGKRREDVIDRPTAWDEVVFKVVPLQEGEEDVNELEEEPEVIPPIPDPLGISSVDLRSIQAFYTSGRLMRSQTGQLARRATNMAAALPINGATPTGGRKTSFRGSTTFTPYLHEEEDSDDSDADEDSGAEEAQQSPARTTKPGFDKEGTGDGADATSGATGAEEGGARPALEKTRSASAAVALQREKKVIPSVVPSDKNFSTVLFLTLVHGSASFNQLKAGMDHLQQHLMLQSSRRENLVRLHFGLFVQCAEGLEFLKAFRKGVVKNAIRNRRGSAVRKSVAGAEDLKSRRQSAVQPSAASPGTTDKGLERLKRSQATLDAAKVEALRTLAPILERMKQSRRIKSAEKVLKRMTALLEYPVRMRTALDRGELSEVVAIYQRVQAVQTSSSSLRILHKIKEAASLVITDLKKQCFAAMLSPNANYTTLLRYGKIWQDLEGEASYYELLRQSTLRQILHFVERMRELRDKFCADCADANDRGMEQNLLRRSPFLTNGAAGGAADRESVSAIVRRHAEVASSRKRQGQGGRTRSASGQDFGSEVGLRGRTSSESVIGNHWDEDDDVNFQDNHDEFEVEDEDSDADWLGDDDDIGEEFLEGDMDDLDFLDDLAAEPGSAGGGSGSGGGAVKRKSLTFSEDVRGGDDGGGLDPPSRRRSGVGRDVNHSALLCSLVRHGYVEAMVDLLGRWFPCLFRLVSALASLQHTTGASTAPSAPAPLVKSNTGKTGGGGGEGAATERQRPVSMSLGPGGAQVPKGGAPAATTAGYTNLSRGAIAAPRVLGAALKIYGDYLKQVISGVEPSFSLLSLPSELVSAFNEVDSFICNAHFPVHAVSPVVSSLVNAVRIENKAYDAVAGAVLINPLREPFHRDALQEVYELYNAMEFIMKREAAAAMTAAGSGAAAPGNTLSTRVPFGPAGIKSYLNFLSPTSPYYDSMSTLQALSKEGEVGLAQKILDKLMDLSAELCTYDQDRLLALSNPLAGNAASRAWSATSGLLQDSVNLSADNRVQRRGSVLTAEVVAAGAGAGAAGVPGGVPAVGMEHNVTELDDLIMRCLRSVRLKVKREEWVATVVQEGVQRVFSSFVEALRLQSFKVSDGNTSSRSRDSILGASLLSGGDVNGAKRGRRSGTNMRSSVSNGLVLESLEDELKFGDTDHNRARLQLDLLRACVQLRCRCIPHIGGEIRQVFAVPDEEEGRAAAQQRHAVEKAAQDAKAKAAATAAAQAGNNLLSRTKSTLMTKLFAATADKDADPPSGTVIMETPTRAGHKGKKKLTLHSILTQFVKGANVDLFENNLREVVTIEDQAASTYVNIKTKEIRTTVFAGFSMLVHTEAANAWNGLNGSGAVKIPVHLARVLLSLGNEKRLLAEALGDLRVLRGDTAGPEEEETPAGQAVPAAPVAAGSPPAPVRPGATRSLFSPVAADSGSESDEPAEVAAHPKNAAKHRFTERLLYRDHLYRQLCLGLLQVYQDLITRLRTNSFSANSAESSQKTHDVQRHRNRRQADMFTAGSSDDEADGDSSGEEAGNLSKVPFSLGQAVEEFKYLKELLLPLLSSDLTISPGDLPSGAAPGGDWQAQANVLHRHIGRQFPSASQLLNSGRMFAVMISTTDA